MGVGSLRPPYAICTPGEDLKMPRLALSAAALGALALLPATQATAGVIRNDRSDSTYRELAAQYPSAGRLLFAIDDTFQGTVALCSGVLITPDFVLTAAHCIDETARPSVLFTVEGQDYVGTRQIIHPQYTGNISDGFDIALVQLDRSVVGVAPAPIYTGSNEVGQTGVSVGFGRSGVGSTGATTAAGIERAGQHTIDSSQGFFGPDGQFLLSDFDDPNNSDGLNAFGSTVPLDLEYAVAGGDSGGGLFLNDGGTDFVAGIGSFIGAFGGSAGDGSPNSSYSDISGFSRVSAFTDFINSTIPEPGSAMVLAVAGLGLLSRHRRR